MVDVIIVGAGSGSRLGENIPKAFVSLNERPILYYSLKTFEEIAAVDNIVLVVPEDYIGVAKDLVASERFKKVKYVVRGGAERKDSVANGFAELDADADFVLIHDAARPLIPEHVIDAVIKALRSNKAVIPVVPAVDTVKLIDSKSQEVKETLDRDCLACVQTPQGFSVDLVPYLIEKASQTTVAFDEAMLLEGYCPIKTVEGDVNNFKITVPGDMVYASLLLSRD